MAEVLEQSEEHLAPAVFNVWLTLNDGCTTLQLVPEDKDEHGILHLLRVPFRLHRGSSNDD